MLILIVHTLHSQHKAGRSGHALEEGRSTRAGLQAMSRHHIQTHIQGWGSAEPRWTSVLSFSVKELMARRSDVSQEMGAQGTEKRKRVNTQAFHSLRGDALSAVQERQTGLGQTGLGYK